jgi:hypothetical protein
MLLKYPIVRIVERERDFKTWYLIYDCNFVLDCRKGLLLKRCVPTTPVHKRRTLFRRRRGTFQVVWPQQTWRELLKFDNFWKLYHHIRSKSFEFQQGSQWHLTTLVVLFLKRVSELLLFEFLTSIFVLVPQVLIPIHDLPRIEGDVQNFRKEGKTWESWSSLRKMVFLCSCGLVFLGCRNLCFLSFYNSSGNPLSWMMEAAALMGSHHDQWRCKTPSFCY